jgi:hypothetical protein
MNYLLALVCFIGGIACFVWLKPLSKANAEFVARRMKGLYGSFATKMGWDDPQVWQTAGYKLGMIGVGLALVSVAFYLIFGTIHIG